MASKTVKPDIIGPHPLITTDHAAVTPLGDDDQASASAPIRQKIVIRPLDDSAETAVTSDKPTATEDGDETTDVAAPASDTPSSSQDTTKAIDTEAVQMEADARAQDELDTLVAAKTYFLPINSVEHRRSRRVFIFGSILILVLALAWLDVAMDAGFVTLPGVKPLTHLFRS